MIDHLIEIIFKDIPAEQIGLLLKDLSSEGGQIINYNFTCDSPVVEWNSGRSIEKVFNENRNFGLFINLKEIKKNGLCLPNCGIAVYKNEKAVNLEINFQLSELKEPLVDDLVKNLMMFAKPIAVQYQIDVYFCGLEPAQEMKTRLFTNEELGPFFIEN